MKHTLIELNYLQMLTISNLPVVQALFCHSHCPLCSCQLVARVDDVLGEDADVVAVVVISLHHWRPILCLAEEADGDVAVEEDLRCDVKLNLWGGRVDMRQEHFNCLERQFQKFNFQLSKVSSWDCCVASVVDELDITGVLRLIVAHSLAPVPPRLEAHTQEAPLQYWSWEELC